MQGDTVKSFELRTLQTYFPWIAVRSLEKKSVELCGFQTNRTSRSIFNAL